MFENLKQVFVKEINEVESKEMPYLNEPTTNIGRYPGVYAGQYSDKKTMMDYAKRHAVIIGIVKAISTDIVTKFTFRSIRKRGKGRPREDLHLEAEENAMDFAKKNLFKQTLYSAVYDWIITGEGFIWHGEVSKDKV